MAEKLKQKELVDEDAENQVFNRPTGLRGFYYHPTTQIVLLGFVCFMGPGMFGALTGLGGGGQVNATTAANANTALYATLAFVGFFAGSINNKLGPRLTLFLGSSGYPLYIGSFLAINIHPHAGNFVIAAGAVLGVSAALLWTAQGSLMLAYPTENQKGKFIGIFWTIFNLGGVVGAAVSLGQNIHSESNHVGNGTYIGFLALTLIGVAIPMFMADPEKMIRTNGTKVTKVHQPSWKAEIHGLWVTLRTDPYIILLFPMFFSSNWFYTWRFNDYNSALFNIRGRSLNNFVYWLSQIFGSVVIGLLLDQNKFPRRVRAFTGWAILLVMVFAVHIWGYFYQKNYTRESVTEPSFVPMDILDSGYPARIWFFIFCGILDAIWQTTAYWIVGAMSNDPTKLAYLIGFYKGIQSAGSAGVWRADAVGTPFMSIFASTWALFAAGLVCTLPMLHFRITNHTIIEDETVVRKGGSVEMIDHN